MKFTMFFSFLLFLSCETRTTIDKEFRQDFTQSEKDILEEATKIIGSCDYTTLITLDENAQPRARVMETLEPEAGFVIWMGTNPKSRKVLQIKANSKVTMHYFDQAKMGYVSLMGEAFIVDDIEAKSKKWKEGWEQFYKNRTDDYILIQFVPETIEVIGMLDGFSGDSLTWAPHKVVVRK